jgi:von Willebrand factor type A domain
MRSGVRSSFEFLSMSTLDLFASILGTFVLITFVLLPYYLRQPFLEHDIAQAQAETSALAAEMRLYREKLTATRTARSEAEDALVAAQHRLASAKALAAAQPSQTDKKNPAPSPLPSPFAIRDLDLVFVVDTTGSMRHEIADMKANLIGVINILNRLSSSLRIGIVAYKDRGEIYVTRDFPLRPMEGAQVGQLLDFVRGLEASGGGDDPEPIELALKVAIDMPWRTDAQGRIVVIGDALSRDRKAAFDLATQFKNLTQQAELPRVVSTIFAGDEPASARFFEQIAAAGGGEYSINQGQIIETVAEEVVRPRGADSAKFAGYEPLSNAVQQQRGSFRALPRRDAVLLGILGCRGLDHRPHDLLHGHDPVADRRPLLAVPLLDADRVGALVVGTGELERWRQAGHP